VSKTKSWFEVDRNGLRKLLDKRGKTWVVCELLQNAFDENVTEVLVKLRGLPNKALCRLEVTDDSPDGFRDLTHAWTLFAESYKKDDPTKRGRFNIGEKLLLSMCTDACIMTTTGTVTFDGDGSRRRGRARRDVGTWFGATIRMTRAELDDTIKGLARVVPPAGVELRINGVSAGAREPVGACSMVLPTVRSDEEGNLHRTNRKTEVTFHKPVLQPPFLFEMGIPICRLDDGETHDINVHQKVPLPLDRDRVSQSYLRKVRVALLNTMCIELADEDFDRPWAREATGDKTATKAAVSQSIKARFGDKVVASDPSDPEGTKIAVSEGYTVAHGGSLSAGEWENVRRYDTFKPAGQVTPSPKPYAEQGEEVEKISEADLPANTLAAVHYSKKLLALLLDRLAPVTVYCIRAPRNNFRAAWCRMGPEMHFNLGKISRRFWGAIDYSEPETLEELHALLLHEAAHNAPGAGDHLSEAYYRELCRLGAKLATLAIKGQLPL